jgi:hypothetical protein
MPRSNLLKSFRRWFQKSLTCPSTSSPLRRRRARPCVELLEDRSVPAVAFALGSTLADMAEAVAADNIGNLYLAGSFNGTVDFDPGPGIFNLTSTGNADAFLAKYNSSGGLLWAGQIVDSGGSGAVGGLALDFTGAVPARPG